MIHKRATRLYNLLKISNKRMLTPEEKTETETLKTQMEKIIDEYCRTPIERATIKKRYIEGKTWATITNELMDLSEDTPRKRAYRALDRLRH